MQQRKALAQELPVKSVVKAIKKRRLLTAADLAVIGRDCGGDPDVTSLVAEAVWLLHPR